MYYLYNLKEVTPTNYIVGGVHYKPFDEEDGLGKTAEQLRENGILVDTIPQGNGSGQFKLEEMHVNPLTKDIWYEYLDKDLTQEELFQQANQKVSVLEKTVADLEFQLMMGGIL